VAAGAAGEALPTSKEFTESILAEGVPQPPRRGSRLARRLRAGGVILMGLSVSVAFGLLTFGDFHRGPHGWEFVSRINSTTLVAAINQTHWAAIGLFVVITIATLPLRAIQWGDIVSPKGTFRDRYHATAIGFLAINILPARLGEVSRGLLLAYRLPGLSRSLSVGSVIYGRVFDIFVIWLMALPLPFVLHFDPSMKTFLTYGFLALTILAWGAVLLSWIVQKHGPAASRQVSRLLGETIGGGFSRFCQGFGTGVKAPAITRAMLWTLAFQVVSAAAYIPVMHEVCPQLPPVWSAIYGLAAVSVGLALPSTPSGIGIYHFAMASALRSVGASDTQAVAVAVITHLASLAAFVMAGLASIVVDWPSGLKLRQGLQEEAEEM
jgi:uncharacterized protein (TIRG00374 family)